MKFCRTCQAENSVGATACEACGVPFGIPQSAKMEEAKTLLTHMPVLSLHTPPGWDFTPISLVTAQTVSGTGLFAELTSTVTDMFGRQSGAFINKLRTGEEMCKAALRLEAMRLRAHAILGTDIDYAEVGGARSMLMVCMAGTAVRLNNLDALEPAAAQAMKRCSDILLEIDGSRSDRS